AVCGVVQRLHPFLGRPLTQHSVSPIPVLRGGFHIRLSALLALHSSPDLALVGRGLLPLARLGRRHGLACGKFLPVVHSDPLSIFFHASPHCLRGHGGVQATKKPGTSVPGSCCFKGSAASSFPGRESWFRQG